MFVFFSILNYKTTRRDSRESGGNPVTNGDWNHMGFFEANYNEWKPKLDVAIDKKFDELEKQRKKFDENWKKSKNNLNDRTIKQDNTRISKPKISNPRNL